MTAQEPQVKETDKDIQTSEVQGNANAIEEKTKAAITETLSGDAMITTLPGQTVKFTPKTIPSNKGIENQNKGEIINFKEAIKKLEEEKERLGQDNAILEEKLAKIVELQPNLPKGKSATTKKKGFWGTIGNGISSFVGAIGTGLKAVTNGTGKGFGKVSNGITQRCQNRAKPSLYTDRRKVPDEILRKFPIGVFRKVLVEPVALALSGVGSLLSRDSSYIKNAWNRFKGDMNELIVGKSQKGKIVPFSQTAAATTENTKQGEGKVVPFSSSANKTTEEKSAIPSVQTKTAANTSSLTDSAKTAKTKSEENKQSSTNTTTEDNKSNKNETVEKTADTTKNSTTKTKENNVVKFSSGSNSPKELTSPQENKKISTISAGDQFYYDHKDTKGNDVLTYDIKHVDGDNIYYIDHDSSTPNAMQVTTKEKFLQLVNSGKYYKKTELKQAA